MNSLKMVTKKALFNALASDVTFNAVGSHSKRLLSVHHNLCAQGSSALSKIRKATGFSLANCRKALEKFDNNVEEAEKWMKSEAKNEGWARATKLAGREMSQGLIGVLRKKDCGLMLEVNCETDFVSKNKNFHRLITDSSAALLTKFSDMEPGKILLSSEEIKQLPFDKLLSFGDRLALAIGEIGENIAISRGVFMKATKENCLQAYVHPGVPSESVCLLGKFAALASLRGGSSVIGMQLCQHIVGMKPQTLGDEAELTKKMEELQKRKEEKSKSEEVDSESDEDEDDDEQEVGNLNKSEPEVVKCLLEQEFLMDPTISVLQFIKQNNCHVHDFVRYQCGES